MNDRDLRVLHALQEAAGFYGDLSCFRMSEDRTHFCHSDIYGKSWSWQELKAEALRMHHVMVKAIHDHIKTMEKSPSRGGGAP